MQDAGVDATIRAYLRRRVADERRRRAGVEPDGDASPRLRVTSKSVAVVAWEAADGDGLTALALALDVLAQREAA